MNPVRGACSGLAELMLARGRYGKSPEQEDPPRYPTMRLFSRGFAEGQDSQMLRVVRALWAKLAAP